MYQGQLDMLVPIPAATLAPALDIPVSPPDLAPEAGWYARRKPLIEAVLAAVLLVLTAPITLLAALLVKLTSRGSSFYTQTRVGRGGQLFTIYKLRTMVEDAERRTGPAWSQAGDPRVTRLGRLLRDTHVDEFPQLFNVLLGQMSLVGPRPERPEIVAYLSIRVENYTERLRVRPGITGLAQVHLPPDVDLEGVRKKLVCDRYYLDWISAFGDARLLLCTGLLLFGVPLAWSRGLLGIPCPLRDGG